MKYPQLLPFLLVAGVTASSAPGILEDIQRSLQEGVVGSILKPRQTKNLQTFTGALGGARADAVTESGDSQRPFAVAGDTFTDFTSAAGRSCDNQKNSCAQMANNGTVTFTVSDCDEQNTQCHSAISKEANVVSAELSSTTSTSSTSTSTSTSTSSTSTSTSETTTSTSSTTSLETSTTAAAAIPAVATTNSFVTPPAETTTAAATFSTASSALVVSTTSSASLALVSQNAEFDFFCEV